jgi:hypothetical protein
MRAAAFTSIAIIAIGAYLMIAASVGLSPTWIGLGVLVIALTAAVALVGTEPRSAASR